MIELKIKLFNKIVIISFLLAFGLFSSAQTTITLSKQCNCNILSGDEFYSAGSLFPTGEFIGQIYIQTVQSSLYFWNGASWESILSLSDNNSKSIDDTLENSDYSVTFNYSDGTSFTTSVLLGPQGPSGDKGIQGVPGLDGTNGLAGADGATGTKGDTGLTGAVGAAGTDGIDGEQGIKGEIGNDGTNGVAGADGETGADGADGATGPKGDTGLTGAVGADGTDGIDGEQGIKGEIGNDGTNGTNGVAGADGETGADGADGATGPKGDTGLTGANGVDGVDGEDGVSTDTSGYYFTLPGISLTGNKNTNYTFNLYNYFTNLFSNAFTSSPGAPGSINNLGSNDYYYYISSYVDIGIFNSASINSNGILTYNLDHKIDGEHQAIINVTLLVK